MNATAPPVIQTALADLERALARDGSHALMTGSPASARASLLTALPQHLSGRLAAVGVSLAGLSAEQICPALLRELHCEPDSDPEAQLRQLVRDLVSRGSALVVLVDDAGALPSATLRRLGDLASAAPGLRVALFLSAAEGRDDGGATRVVAELGLGVQKIVLHGAPAMPRRTGPRTAAPPEAAAVASGVAAWKLKMGEGIGIPVAAPQRRRTRGIAMGVAATLAVGLGLGFVQGLRAPTAPPVATHMAPLPALLPPTPVATAPTPTPASAAAPVAPTPVEPVSVEPVPVEPVLLERPAPQRIAAAALTAPTLPEPAPLERPAAPQRVETALVTTPAPPAKEEPVPVSPAAAEPTPRAVAALPSVRETAPAVPAVRVKINARPWARIEVDGRDVGITPLGNVRLSRGDHHFRAQLPDGSVLERTVRIDANRDRVTFP